MHPYGYLLLTKSNSKFLGIENETEFPRLLTIITFNINAHERPHISNYWHVSYFVFHIGEIFADTYLFPKKLIKPFKALQMGRVVDVTVGMAAQFTGNECLPVVLHFYHLKLFQHSLNAASYLILILR